MQKLCAALTAKAIFTIVFLSISGTCVSATNHTVGGSTGWDIDSNVQSWAGNTLFYTGDNLVFYYGPLHDVLEVDKRDFSACQTNRPLRTYHDGKTVITLNKPGTRYFICGMPGHCDSGLKLQVDVSNSTSNSKKPQKPPHRPPPPNQSATPASPNLKPRPPPPSTWTAPPSPDNPGPNQVSASEVQCQIACLLFSLFFIVIIILLGV